MPVSDQTASNVAVTAYVDERIGAFTIPGPHHRDTGSQDTFWPASDGNAAVMQSLSRLDVAQHGRLYILADGVSLCADGKEASRIATQTAGNYYYQTAGAYPNTEAGRMQRLEDAVWQAHLRVSSWDERYFCWRSDKHPDGVAHHFRREQVKTTRPPLCPLCNQPIVGLQTTFLAALMRGQHLIIVGVGDCSAFRLPANPDYGVEWIYTPQDGQFLGMPSLNRQAIIGQTFVLNAGDNLTLCSDGLVKVLNGLHSDMGWHQFLRQRLTNQYQAEVTELLLDLDGWRLSKPRQRKLHDDLTLVAAGLIEESVQNQYTQTAFEQYDALCGKQAIGALGYRDYEPFIQSAETALINDDNSQLWHIFGSALYAYALALVNADKAFRDESLLKLLQKAAEIGRRGTEWPTAYQRLGQISLWLNKKDELRSFSADAHTQLISDLYAVDMRIDMPDRITQLQSMMAAVADQLEAIGLNTAASQYRSFRSYLSNKSKSEPTLLPARGDVAVTVSTEEENTKALEQQITQAISNGQWEIAQELIVELNKLKGSNLNLDTEGVDTSPTRPINHQSALMQSAMPASPMMRPGAARIPTSAAKNGNGDKRRHELVMPFSRVQRVFHSREPKALMRDTAIAAFSTNLDDFDLSMAYDLMREAQRLYPRMGVNKTEWRTLWDDPHAEFNLLKDASADCYKFEQLAKVLKAAEEMSMLTSQSQAVDLRDLRKSDAKASSKQLEAWQTTLTEGAALPHALGLGAWWYVNQLIHTRLHMPQERDLTSKRRRLTPFDQARLHYAEGVWQATLAQPATNALTPTFSSAAQDNLIACEKLQEQPWSAAARQLIDALQHDNIIVRAFHTHYLRAPENATVDEQMRLQQLKDHVVGAAWDVTFAQAEGRMPIDGDALSAAQTTLVNAPFDVTQPEGPGGLRLGVLYSLLSLLLHEADGPIVNGFYAYEVKVPRQLSEADFRRLADLRSNYVTRAWETTLHEAARKQPFYLPPSGKFISRVRPDRATPEGRRLQAVRALLPHLSQVYDDWLDYALFIFQWKPPLTLADADQERLNELNDSVVEQSWNYILNAIRGDETPSLKPARINSVRSQLTDLRLDETATDRPTRRLRAIANLMPLLLRLKADNSTMVQQALQAQRIARELSADLPEADAAALAKVCELPLETLWAFTVRMIREPDSADSGQIATELDAFNTIKQLPNDNSATWEAVEHLLLAALNSTTDNAAKRWDDRSQDMFRAFQAVNIERDVDERYDVKNQELYELSYFYLVDWKDSLPESPGLFKRRRINNEKRRIQEYWLLRKEYGM